LIRLVAELLGLFCTIGKKVETVNMAELDFSASHSGNACYCFLLRKPSWIKYIPVVWVTLSGIQVTDSVSGLEHFLIKLNLGVSFILVCVKNNIVIIYTMNLQLQRKMEAGCL